MPRIRRTCIALHGRNPENRNDRRKRGGMVQMIDECFVEGKTFNLSTVSKDCMILEYMEYEKGRESSNDD